MKPGFYKGLAYGIMMAMVFWAALVVFLVFVAPPHPAAPVPDIVLDGK